MSQVINIKNGDWDAAMDDVAELTTKTLCTRIITRAKLLAPVDTGRLRNGLMWRVYKSQGGFNDHGGEMNDKEITVRPTNATVGWVGVNLLYAVYMEFGTRNQAPRPYLRPAIELAKTGAVDEVRRKIIAEQALGKLKKGETRTTWNI